MGRTGASYATSSGDFAIAFSSAPEARARHGQVKPVPRALLPPDALSPLFQAAMEATEEAIDNSLLQATEVRYRGKIVEAIPIERLRVILKKYGVTP